MTPDHKMRLVVEAAGERWHEVLNGVGRGLCACGETAYDCLKAGRVYENNPSPTDLNELDRLRKKLNLYLEIDSDPNGLTQVSAHAGGVVSKKPSGQGIGGSLKVALLNALYESIKEA